MSKKQVSAGMSGSGSIRAKIDYHLNEHTFVEIKVPIGRAEHLLIKTSDRLDRMIEWLELPDDGADSTADDMVPELGQKLLPFLLPRKLRDAVAGDLAQDFQGYLAKFGRTYAVRWYWWELGRLCVSRLTPTAIVASIAFWLRRKFGF
jgi:hypothetical protein